MRDVVTPLVDAGRRLFVLSIGVFGVGGFLTSVVGLLVPRFRLTLGLGYAEALLVQLAFHSSYLLFALPIALAVVRLGYMRAIVAGLAVMALGCTMFVGADATQAFGPVLAALLLLSVGQTVLQIAANTVVTVVGAAAGSAARLTLLQGFNSLGTVLGPLLTAQVLLAGPARAAPAAGTVGVPFVASAIVLAALAVAFWCNRDLLGGAVRAGPALRRLPQVLRDRRLLAGTAAMFAYVGAEVTIGTLLTNYLMRTDVLGAAPADAGRLVSLYWGGAMAGRFAGAALLRLIRPPRLLAAAGIGAAVLTLVATTAGGVAGATALLAVGLCNAIMYPTIYAMALPVDAETAPLGSMLLCMAVVGGAVVPMLTGIAADAFGLGPALALPALCYAGIALFARGYR